MFDSGIALLDWLGIVAFTITGALAASRNQMDPVGFVLLADGYGEDDLPSILADTNVRLGKTQRLSMLHPIDEMPRSHIGKLLKTELRALAETLAPAA